MKHLHFTANQNSLSRALTIASRTLSDNNAIPICASFLFSIEKNKLTISASDLQNSITTSVEITSTITLKICVEGNKLKDYIGKLPKGEIGFDILEHITQPTNESVTHPISGEVIIIKTEGKTNHSIKVTSGQSKLSLPCQDAEGFPNLLAMAKTDFELPAEDLMDLLFKTMFAISDDDLRPSLTGLFFEIGGGKIKTTATDTHKLATYTSDIDTDFTGLFIVPKASLQKIQSLSPTGPVQFAIFDGQVLMQFADVFISARLIDEKYPDYMMVLPTENHIDFVTDRAGLITAIKRIIPIGNNERTLKLSIFSDHMNIIAENSDYNEDASEVVPGSANDEIIIGAKGEFLLSILNSLAGNDVWFSLSAPNRAMFLTDKKHVNPGKENLCLLMPCVGMVHAS